MARLLVFDDGRGRLAPLTDLRAAFELRTGAVTTAERLARTVGPPAGYIVPEPLEALVAERADAPVNRLPGDADDAGDDEPYLLVNGRWTAVHRELPTALNTAVIAADGSLAAALVDRAAVEAFIADPSTTPAGLETIADDNIDLITRPWHVIEHARANLVADLAACDFDELDADWPGVIVTGDRPVRVGPGVTIGAHVSIDTTGGAVCIDAGATIAPLVTITGPCFIGADATVIRHADIRANTVIGPVCKVGGEISGTVFQGHANKSHFGFVGDSFIGEWVNLGAGTTTSNLKNTYGVVGMQTDPDEPCEPTGMTFLGAIVGDHVKTAIGTRMITGCCIHTGAMVAVSTFATKCIERFAFLTDAGRETYDPDRFNQVADRVMRRRGREVTPALRARFAALRGA